MSQICRNRNGGDSHGAPAGREERREERFAIAIEIEVSGIGRDGKAFHQRTVTTNVSIWGCAFPLSVELKPDDIIAVRMISTTAKELPQTGQAMFQVVRVTREADGWAVAAWKMDGGDAWGDTVQNIAKSKGSDAPSHATTRDPREEAWKAPDV
jgi:PilZ domain